jgi:branched-chain amino acid transport system substrate-binding protein
VWFACGLAAVALLAAACSDSKSTSSGGSGGSAASSVDLTALGTPNAATGTPVTIGLIHDGGGQGVNQQADLEVQGAQLAIKYINDYRGGLAGRPIDLFVCGNQSTPAGAQDCANQMVEKKVAAVVWPFTGQGSSVPILTGAGIPIIGISGASTEELTTPGVFLLTGGFPATLGAYAQDAKDHNYKKFAMLINDVPALTQGIPALGGPAFQKAGVELKLESAPVGTPDLTPQLQDAISQGADAVGVTGDVTFCTAFLKAYQTLALTVPKYVIGTCNDPSVTASLGNVLQGSTEATTTGPSDSPDAKIYAAIINKYAPGGSIDPDPAKSTGVALGLTPFLTFSNAVKNFTGDATPANLGTYFKTAKGDVFLGGGITFDCASKPIAIIPNVCSAALQIGTVQADGTVTDLKPVDPTSLFQP